MALNLYIREIADYFLRENFRKITDMEKKSVFLDKNFTFFEIQITGSKTNFRWPHNLSFVPKDVIQTDLVIKTAAGLVSTGTLVWNSYLFNDTFLDITTTAANATDILTVRAFIGRYE